jgi:sulfur carrier protein ThiS
MKTEIQTQLEQIEAQKQALLEQQKQLEKEAQYGKTLETYLNFIEKTKQQVINNNKSVKYIFDLLSQDENVKELIEIVEYNTDEIPSSYYAELIKEEDRIESFPVIRMHIKTKFGSIHPSDIEGDKVRLPYKISSQYRFYKIETVIKKFKEALEKEERENNSKKKLEQSVETIIKKFSNLYPDAIIGEGKEHIKVWNEYTEVSTIKITFKNTSQVKLRVFEDGSYSIMEKVDHRVKNLKKDELISYLAS